MSRNSITGSILLLTIAALAVLWHNVIPGKKAGNTAETGVAIAFSTPEQKYLVCGPFDINSATVEELEAVPRIGPSLAKRIYEFKNNKGTITSLDKLLEIKGVGPRILEVIKQYIIAGKGSAAHEVCK